MVDSFYTSFNVLISTFSQSSLHYFFCCQPELAKDLQPWSAVARDEKKFTTLRLLILSLGYLVQKDVLKRK